MRKQLLLSVFVLLVSILYFNNKAIPSGSGAPPGYTGAPGDVNNCTQCHTSFGVNTGTATVSLTGMSVYVPSQTYTLTVSITNFQDPKNGFEIVVLKDSDNTETGTLIVTDALNTQIVPAAKNYLTHTSMGNTLSSWTFNWTAPSTDVGSITFYAALNDANNNFNASDDYIYTTTLTVNTCSVISISPSITNATCNGNTDGEIDATVNTGSPPYTYSWSNGATTEDLTSLSAGVYTVTVTDNLGCTGTANATVTEPAAVSASIFTNDTIMFCQGGSALLQVQNPDPSHTYQWLKSGASIGGATANTYLAKKSGNHRVEITDLNGCSNMSNIILITKFPRPTSTLTLNGTVPICVGDSVELIANAGNYTYQWIRNSKIQSGASGISFYAKSTGNHKVLVTDANGCFRPSNKIFVNRHPRVQASVTPSGTVTFCPPDSLQLNANVIAGLAPYTYQWYRYNTAQTGKTNADFYADKFGGYSVEVTDANGCVRLTDRTIVQEVCRIGNFVSSNELEINAYPNPFNETLKVKINTSSSEMVHLRMKDVLGNIVFESKSLFQDDWLIPTTQLKAGLYILESIQGENVQQIKMMKFK